MENENENERVELKKVLANTLQGRIYLAIDRSNKQWIVVKETWKELVKLGTSRDGHRVPENFLKELEIHKYLSLLNDADEGFTRVITSWQDDQCYFVASEFCNRGLFDYIKEIHTKGDMAEYARQQSLKEQKALLKPNQWIGMAQDMFKQCVRCVSWMHSKGICHLDLSLENTMLMSPKKGSSTPLVKIIDFGLAQRFKNDNYFHDQRVGKTGYMAPEVYSKQNYDARFADIWSLGVMLFMMLIGAPPYEFPHKNNPAFNFIINDRLADVLIHWKRLRLVTKDALDLMTQIFRPEKDRINMSKIRQHPFVALDNHNEEKNHDDNNDGGNNANNGGNVNNNGNCNNNNNDNDNCNNDNCNNNNNNNNDE